MFSEFVNFREVDLIINNKPSKLNFGLVSLDITHNNEFYQLSLASLIERLELTSLTGFLQKELLSDKQIFLKVKYELKKSHSKIVDLYKVIPERNKWILQHKKTDSDIFVLNCELMSRENADFTCENNLVANF